ncbi:MAG: NUDIX hydrolase [Rhodothermales bacterium]
MRTRAGVEQVAAIPYRCRGGSVEVLLVTSRTNGRWIVPKGNVEVDVGPRGTARLEAFEEGGVDGAVAPAPIGRYRHDDEPDAPFVEAYLLRVHTELDEWPEDGERARRWLPLRVAAERVDVEGLRPLLHRVAAHLEASPGTTSTSP